MSLPLARMHFPTHYVASDVFRHALIVLFKSAWCAYVSFGATGIGVNMFIASTSEIYTLLDKNHRVLSIFPAIYSCSDARSVTNSFLFGRRFSYICNNSFVNSTNFCIRTV